MKFPKSWWESTDVLDLASLDESQLTQLDELWDEISDEELQPFPEITEDETRIKIDDTFEDILEIDGISTVREYLGREPVVTDEPL